MTMMKDSRKPVPQDDGILSSFDPLVEGASFQILEAGLDPRKFSLGDDFPDELEAPEVLTKFDLAASLARVPEKLFFRIGEVADLLEVKAYVLRFWETKFLMVSPSKSRSGQRVNRKKDVETLLLIKHLLYVERFSIEGARKRIHELRQKAGDRASRKKMETSPVKETSELTRESRDTLRATLAEIESLAKADPLQFFRF